MTNMEEQKMFEMAQAGDPKAQFEMSQWARQMSALEPNEERWNRLAAKALVDSANAGYEPAKAMVKSLIDASRQPKEEKEPMIEKEPVIVDPMMDFRFDEPVAEDEYDEGPAFGARSSKLYDQEQEEDFFDDEDLDDLDDMIDYENSREAKGAGALGFVKKLGDGAKKLGGKAKGLGGLVAGLGAKKSVRAEKKAYEEENKTVYEGRRASAHSAQKSGFAGFIEENWSVVRIVCVAICVVLIALIVILLVPGKKEEAPVVTPMPTMVPATPVPTPEPFPNEATMLEIRSTATLQYRPTDNEFLPASQTMTVICEGSENLRQGPGAGDYPDVILQLAQGTQVTVYAKHSTTDTDANGQPISWYLLNSGGTWGWMYGPSLG